MQFGSSIMTVSYSKLLLGLIASTVVFTTALFADTTRTISGPELSATVSSKGEIVALTYGIHRKEHPVRAALQLVGCHVVSPVSTQRIDGNGVSFSRRWVSDRDSSACVVVERFFPVGKSIRWEADIRGTGSPWTAPIETQFSFPDADREKFWAPWGDPKQGSIASMDSSQQAALGISTADTAWKWSDPLVAIPFVRDTLWYGAEAYSYENPLVGFIPFQGNLISIPLVTVLESDTDDGLSIALSPEDQMLDLRVVVDEKGKLEFSRLFHRISERTPVRFSLDLVPHEGDWRGGLRWMTERYPAYFDPVVTQAHLVAGTGAYSAHERAFDTAKMKKMAFGVNWKASFDFPYMGMFLPPVKDDTTHWTRYGGGPASLASMRDYSASMRSMGFHVLSYFNITEFGASVTDTVPLRTLSDAELWRDCNQFLYSKLAGAILRVPPQANEKSIQQVTPRSRLNRPYYTWGDGIAMDPGDPGYQRFLLDQARRHIDKIPDASGICIDRMDWLRMYNQNADDSISWFGNAPARSLLWSWRNLLARLGPMMHDANKVIFVNNHDKRIDLLNHTDGFYDEFTYAGSPLNLTALLGIRKPTIGWTGEEKHLRPDPDVFFQKYLYLGVFPTAPFPGNDHSLRPSEWVDRQYLDYGPLLQTLRGKKWVLASHCVEVSTGTAKANLFEVPGGWVLPVAFGPREGKVTVKLRHVPGLSVDLLATALHPGSDALTPVAVRVTKGTVELTVPLLRGCAMVKIKNNEKMGQNPGSRIIRLLESNSYPDHRPAPQYQLPAEDHGVVFKHGKGLGGCDSLGARDIWVWEDAGTYHMHYDGAGATGWLACLATSTNLTDWTAHGAILSLGSRDRPDCASASYGVAFKDRGKWHMFYLGTPHTSPPPDLVPAFPYLTMKAEGQSPTGPWHKQYGITPFRPKPGTYYSATASPGFIVPRKKGYLMFYSASTDRPIMRTIGIARTNNLDTPWSIDPKPIVPRAEQIENTSLYYQESDKTWFLFTNHVGLRDGLEYTDAIWVYWTKDLEHWNSKNKALVLDGASSSWSRQIIGLPSVVKTGDKLAVFYDGYAGQAIPPGASSHMRRDVGLAWIKLPILTPSQVVTTKK
jgi:predicted GH43/DUF377 family glycosyl hydrolase